MGHRLVLDATMISPGDDWDGIGKAITVFTKISIADFDHISVLWPGGRVVVIKHEGEMLPTAQKWAEMERSLIALASTTS